MSDADRRRQLARRARLAARVRRRRAHPMLRSGGASSSIRLNMAAMIDIVFLLLIYFMLIAEFRPDESSFTTTAAAASIDAADPFALPEQPITIRVSTAGDPASASSTPRVQTDSPIFAGVASLADFEDAARDAHDLLLAPEQEFVIVAAPSTRWEHTLAIVNTLHLAGYSKIRLDDPDHAIDANSQPAGDGALP